MKSIFTFLFLVVLTIGAEAQPGRCRSPLPENIFRQIHKSVMMQRSEAQKLDVANNAVYDNCLSAEQVKSIASLFIDDTSRLEFARNAYESTFDKENYYFVYDAFAYISTVFMLHDHIQSIDSRPHDYLPPQDPPLNINFASLDYPDARNYKGPSNCSPAISENDFMIQARKFAFNDNEQTRLMLFTQMVQNNCMTVAQLMKLASLLENENNRLTFFRAALHNVFDVANLSFGTQLFGHVPNRVAYNDLINNNGHNGNMPLPCAIHPDQFSDMLNSIKKETFNSTKLTLAKNIIKSRPCFTTGQIRDIVSEFTFESGRLEIAKFAWDYTVDRENYYRVADAFSFSSSKEELMKYIDSRK